MDVEQPIYRMPGMGLTRIGLGEDHLVAGQPRNGYRERKIALPMIDGFCIEPLDPRDALADFNAEFVLAFRDGEKRRVYRLAVDAHDPALKRVVAALGERRSDVDFSRLPPAEALARMRVASSRRASLWLAVVLFGGLALIPLVMWIIWMTR